MKKWLIKKLGGFVTVDEAIKSVEDPVIRNRVLTLAVKDLFNTIGPEDILQVNSDGEWLLKGKPMTDVTKKQLQVDAQNFLRSELWKILKLDVKYQTNKQMFTEGTQEHHFTAGKLWMYTLDTFRTRLKSLSEGMGTFNNKKK